MEWMYSWWTLVALIWLTIGCFCATITAAVAGASHRNCGNRRGTSRSTVAVAGYMFSTMMLLLSIVAWIVNRIVS